MNFYFLSTDDFKLSSFFTPATLSFGPVRISCKCVVNCTGRSDMAEKNTLEKNGEFAAR